MKILVCIKQVPDTNAKININSSKNGIETSGLKWVMNPYDEFAVEEAIKLKEANSGATLSVVSVGPKSRVVEALRTALAMGADEGIIVDVEKTDNLSAAKAIHAVIEKEGGFDMVFTGKQAADDQQSAVTQMLAEKLGTAYANVVSKFHFDGETSEVEREVDGGSKEVFELKGKAVVGANKGLNSPRYASLPGIMKAKKKPLKEFTFSDLGLEDGEKVHYTDFELPPERPPVKMISGEGAEQVASQLVDLLKNEAKVL